MRFRRLPRNLRYLAGLLAFALPMNAVALALMLLRRNNLFLMPGYAVVEFWLLALVYKHTLQSAGFTRWMPWLVSGLGLYVLVDCLRMPDLRHYMPGQQVAQTSLVLVLVGLYFRKLLRELRIHRLWQEPMFWVSVGLLIYSLGYLQIALVSNELFHHSPQLNINVWAVHSLLFILLYACYCRALWLAPPKIAVHQLSGRDVK